MQQQSSGVGQRASAAGSAGQRPGGSGPPAGAGYGGPPRVGGNAALIRMLTFLRGHAGDTGGASLALLLVTVSNLVAPQFISYGIDHGLGRRQPSQLLLAVGGLVIVAICRGVFTFFQGYLAERASQGLAYDLRATLFRKLQQLSFNYYDTMQTGQIMTRLSSDVEQVRQFMGTGVVQIVGGAFTLVGSLILLVRIDWFLTIVSLVLLPLIFVGLNRFAKSVGPLFGQVQQTLGRLNGVLREDLNGILVTRAFARENYESGRYDAINQQLLDKNLLTIRAFANNYTFVFFVSNLVTLAVIWVGGAQVIGALGGHLTLGELIAFNTYLSLLLQMVLTIGFLVPTISRAGASALRVFDITDAAVDIQDPPGARTLPTLSGHVEFKDVSFRYPSTEHNTIDRFSLEVQPGQTVAILGTTGSGKSTVVNLLPRFHDVTEGTLLLDGVDVREVTLHSLRHQIGIVLQEVLLFSGSIRDNIAYGRPTASQEEVEAAARAAMAHDFIMAMPQGYNSVLGERGQGLSGGQRQRVAIARALLIDPRLLILDDSTSALDAETEAEVRLTIDRLMRDKHRTVFVIAQRISTVRDADVIIVLDGGHIAAQGTHEQLLHESPLYNEILGSQLQHSTSGTPSTTGGVAQ